MIFVSQELCSWQVVDLHLLTDFQDVLDRIGRFDIDTGATQHPDGPTKISDDRALGRVDLIEGQVAARKPMPRTPSAAIRTGFMS